MPTISNTVKNGDKAEKTIYVEGIPVRIIHFKKVNEEWIYVRTENIMQYGFKKSNNVSTE